MTGEFSASVQRVLDSVSKLNAAERAELVMALALHVFIRPEADCGGLPPHSRSFECCSSSADPARPEAIGGCPWCRCPLSIVAFLPTVTPAVSPCVAPLAFPDASLRQTVELSHARPLRCAYATVLFGEYCFTYFLGALVLGRGLHANIEKFSKLPECCDELPRRLLLHTGDVPQKYLSILERNGWELLQIPYLTAVPSLFRKHVLWKFGNIFTKLRVLELLDVDRVLFLDSDLLIRSDASEAISSLFDLRPPAAMLRGQRGKASPSHGEALSYMDLWSNTERRETESIPAYQQAGGINAGVMLLQPNKNAFEYMANELQDWYHPEHYGTSMPEQEYLTRFYGVFDQWTHIDCRFNFEVRGWWPFEAVDEAKQASVSVEPEARFLPYDFGKRHAQILESGQNHIGAVVLHFSGTWAKPWDLLWDRNEFRAHSLTELHHLISELRTSGPTQYLTSKYLDAERLWTAMLEWLQQLADAVSFSIESNFGDPLALYS